jgi:DNA-binding IclR family transcriptional regulator
MSGERETSEGLKNGVPIIDRMMDMLNLLQHRQGGASIKDIAGLLALPRSTVYRVLNTLEYHGMVRRSSGSAYMLGPRLLALAAQVVEGGQYDFAEIGRPHLERLTDVTNEASKISIHGDGGVLVVATAHAAHEYGLSINPGRFLPYHAGAAGKLLMAYLEPGRIDQILQRPLHAYTPRTPVDPATLRMELATIRQQGWSVDSGEYSGLVHAFAAPIRGPNGHVVAAISVPFLGDKSEDAMERIRLTVVRTGAAISTSLAQNARLGRPPTG